MNIATPEKLQLYYLLVALAIGLLIGLERSWKERDNEHMTLAGVRTYGLISLLGGSSAILAGHYGFILAGLVFLGLTLILLSAYLFNLFKNRVDPGITSLIAGLLVFILGALAASGQIIVASSTAVVVTVLLNYKSSIHHWVNVLTLDELNAVIQLLLISVLILPLLPNQGYGPWQALNPYEIWMMVVLIAAISFVGYFALKIGGPRRGAIFTGLFSGLVSSTALTLSFSRLARYNPSIIPELSSGILIACSAMFPRMLLLAAIINPALFKIMLVPALVMIVFTVLPAVFYLHSKTDKTETTSNPLKNPLELEPALLFALFLGIIMLLSKVLKHWLGDTGIFILAAVSGIMDVDAINLSLARMSLTDLSLSVAVTGIMIAAIVNNLIKGGMATFFGGMAVGLRVTIPLLLSAIGGIISLWVYIW